MAELQSVLGYHNVSKDKARELITPHTGRNGFYLLRPSTDKQGSVLCTICVTHGSKVLNYRVSTDRQRRTYYVNQSVQFASMGNLISHYTQHALNEATGTKLVTPVGATPPPQNGTEDCYVVMEKPEPTSQIPPKPAPGSRFRHRPLPAAPTPSQQTHPTPRQQAAAVPTPAPIPTPTPTPITQHSTPKLQNHAPQNHTPQNHTPQNQEIPGLHNSLLKPLLKAAMQPYLRQDGSFLLRPSSTSEDQFTLTVSHGGKVLNFKINHAQGEYFITPKSKFGSILELIYYYYSNPIRSKQRVNQRILLVNPIPEDPELVAAARELLQQQQLQQQQQQQQQQQEQQQQQPQQQEPQPAPRAPDALPPPWQEFFNDQYRKPFYHNPETKITTWERPQPPPPPNTQSLPRGVAQLKKIQRRPLPSVPGGQETGGAPSPPTLRKRQTMPITQSRPIVQKREKPLSPLPQNLGNLPANSANDVPLSTSSGGRSYTNVMNRPPAVLPGQQDRSHPQQLLPGQQDRSHPQQPLPGQQDRSHPQQSLPGQQDRSHPQQPLPSTPADSSSAMPPIPPANRTRRHGSIGTGPRPRPPLPISEERPSPPMVRTGTQRDLPPLPPKEETREMPPLPTKEQPPPLPPSRSSPQHEASAEETPPLPPSRPSPQHQALPVVTPPLPPSRPSPQHQALPVVTPPLPPSRPSPQHQALPVVTPQQSGGTTPKRIRKAVIEYEDVPQFKPKIPSLPEKDRQETTRGPPPLPEKEKEVPPLPEKEPSSAARVAPPLPEKEDSTFSLSLPSPGPNLPTGFSAPANLSGSAIPPPPPIGGPPPPPPMGLPPVPSPQPPRARQTRSASEANASLASVTESSGRPFTAGDLMMGAQKLRKVENSPDLRRNAVPETGGGLEGTLNRALIQKFRNVTYSDSEEEFDDVDDEDWG